MWGGLAKRWASGSLAFRMAVIAAVWCIAVLLIAGFVLSRNYEARTERQFSEVARVYLLNLIAGFDFGPGGTPLMRADFGEPRFNLFGSGFSWQVSEEDAPILMSGSRGGSLLPTHSTDVTPFDEGFQRAMRLIDGEQLVLAREQVVIIGSDDRRLTFTVALPLSSLDDDIAGFRANLTLFLAIFATGLVATMLIVIRLGLRPLLELRRILQQVIDGDAERIDGVFPREIAPLGNEVNRLIDQNRRVVERARAHVGNLAHALKTPVSVLSNESRGGRSKLAKVVGEQSQTLQRLVDYHLERARMIAIAATPGLGTRIEPVIAGIVRAMNKIHSDRHLALDMESVQNLRFRGDSRDLEEMLGNLIDNACKWAKSRVEITASPGSTSQTILIEIGDDGPGIEAEHREEALLRGRRFDEKTPGTGLGLSIVADLAEAYGGKLELDESPMGGLLARLELPGSVPKTEE